MDVQNYKCTCTCTLIVIWDILMALNEWRSSESGWNMYWLILASCEILMYTWMTTDIDDYIFYHTQNTCTSICTCTCISNDLISYRRSDTVIKWLDII